MRKSSFWDESSNICLKRFLILEIKSFQISLVQNDIAPVKQKNSRVDVKLSLNTCMLDYTNIMYRNF